MCVWMEAGLSGFPCKTTVSPLPNPVLTTRGERSEMLLFLRSGRLRLVKPASGEISDMELPQRDRYARLVNLASGEISDMLLRSSSSVFRLVNPASGSRPEDAVGVKDQEC